MIYYSATQYTMPRIFLAGEVIIPSPNNHFERVPGEYILYYIRSGHMQLMEGEEYYDLKAGDMLILDPANRHYGIETFSDISYLYIHFSWETLSGYRESSTELGEIIRNIRLNLGGNEHLVFPKYHHFSGIRSSEIKNTLEELVKGVNSAEIFHMTASSLILLDFLVKLGVECMTESRNSSEASSIISDNILTFLHENSCRNLSSRDIEDFFHMNFDYLNRTFKKNTGMTIINYHNRFRILEAKKLLRSRLYNIKEVSEKLGFSNEFYFSRVYKKYEGVSPLSFLSSGTFENI